jgi:DNA repair exonuclease SbcCD nuclease subunit
VDFIYINGRLLEYPYVIISDVHFHNWNAYSYITKEGLNNRLEHILNAVQEAASSLIEAGGKDLVITGDLFHTRGKITPSVFNPVFEMFRGLTAMGIRVHCIPGNHDLEGKNSDKLGNAVQALASIPNFYVYSEPTIINEEFCFIPWFDNHLETSNLATKSTTAIPNLTLFMHVGLSGVLKGNVGHTLNTDDLEALGAKYVFSGHFHNHANFNNRVFSVGALTHQTWGDVGSLAGYILVTEKDVIHLQTSAPMFVGHGNKRTCFRNYVRITDIELTHEEAEKMIKAHKNYGALVVLDQSSRPTIAKTDVSKAVSVDLGINKALESYTRRRFGEHWEKVYNECLKLKS